MKLTNFETQFQQTWAEIQTLNSKVFSHHQFATNCQKLGKLQQKLEVEICRSTLFFHFLPIFSAGFHIHFRNS